VQAALAAYPAGCEQVILATARNFPDALGGAALAGMLDAPILLTEPGALSPQTRTAIGTLGATRAIILGSTDAVSADVETELNGMLTDPAVERVGGANRYETAEWLAQAAVANQKDRSDVAFVATGRNYPDALAAAPIAAANGWPIYLSDTHYIRPQTLAAMHNDGIAKVHILGSATAVGSEVETALNGSFGDANVDRIGDTDRYRTAAALMEFAMRDYGMNISHLAITTGQNYPDALAAGPLQGKTGSVLLLTKKDSVPPILTALPGVAAYVHEVRFLGDTNAISTPVRNQLNGYFW
jgi:putative cell wall-binding protein